MPTSGPPNDRPNPGTWCPATKNQGSGGGEAPRPAHRTPAGPRRRGAPRRKIKALTGARHHVRPTECPPDPATWCPATKDQGFDGGEAPRPACRMPGRARRRGAPRRRIKALTGVKHHVRPAEFPAGPRRRGAPRRKIKALTGVKHHVRPAECPAEPGDVVPRDERSRL